LAQLISPWHPKPSEFVYLEYDGNKGTLRPSARMDLLRGKSCPHHPADEVGDPMFDIRAHLARQNIPTPANSQKKTDTSRWSSLWRRLIA